MIQSKQELLDSLNEMNVGAQREIDMLQDDQFNRPTIRWYEGCISARNAIIAQLTRELAEERPEMGEDNERARRERLEKAIREYYGDEEYVQAWVLIGERATVETVAEGKTMVGWTAKLDQSFAMTRGLLDVALDGERKR